MQFLEASIMTLLTPSTLFLILMGTTLGLVFGAIPGLSGTMGITLLLPMTYFMTPEVGIAMLVAIYVGGISGSFISAVLIGVPGTAASIATCFDGYPMSQKGQTKKALGAGILASFLGTVLSTLVAALLCPVIARLALKLGPWEYFSLCTCAIVLVVAISDGNFFKGIASACIGIFLSTIGIAPIDGTIRFSFGNYNLYGGIDLTIIMLGLFAVRQIAVALGKNDMTMPESKGEGAMGKGLKLKEIISNIRTMVESFFIGLWIGFLPGMGASLSNLVAYARTKSVSKHPEEFGKGCVDGIFASETANNAAAGGAIIPMIALGIPGDGATAMLLGGLMLHGIEPGPLLLDKEPDLVYIVFATVFFAAAIGLVLLMATRSQFSKILKAPYHYLFSAILIICFVGAFAATNSLFNCGLLVAIAAIGVLLVWGGLQISPLILGFVLGPMLESYLRRGIVYGNGSFMPFITRPISLIFLLVAAGSVFYKPIVNAVKKRKIKQA